MRSLSLFFFVLLVSFCSSSWAEEAKFSITTNAFLDAGVLPVLYTCDSKNVSPELSWENAPKGAKFFTLLATQEVKGTLNYSWVLFNLPATTKKLDEGVKTLPSGTVAGKNSNATVAYTGPCPEKGGTATIVFTLYALKSKLALNNSADGPAVLDAMKDHIIEKTQISAVYSRWKD